MTTREKDIAAGAQHGVVATTNPYTSFADGCAHRDRQVIAFLREIRDTTDDEAMAQCAHLLALRIERREHVK